MPEAARLTDPIGHSPTMSWLVAGVLAGAAIGVAVAATVATGGLAAAAIVGGLAVAGGGIGEVLSTMSWAKKEVVGDIISGSLNVFIKGLAAARAHVDKATCSKHSGPPPPLIAQGSGNVYINGLPAARKDDKTTCSAVITMGAVNVFIGGGQQQTDAMAPEDLVPGWVHTALLVAGLGAAVVLAGPIVAATGFVAGLAGGLGGGWVGGKLFGEGSDGQKWMMLGGSFVAGMFGAKGGAWFDKNYVITAKGLGSSFGNIGIARRSQPLKTTPLNNHYLGEDIPNNQSNWLHGRSTVRYLSDAERKKHLLTVRDGKLYDAKGNLFDTSHSQIHWSEGRAIFVMDDHGNVYASNYQKPGEFHHSSLSGGRPVSAAGELEVREGVLQVLSDQSGHYTPARPYTHQAIDVLRGQGVDIPEWAIEWHAP